MIPNRSPSFHPPHDAPAMLGFPRGRHYLLGCVACVLLVVYGSLVPFDIREIPWTAAISQFQNLPYLHLDVHHRADWVANILLFVPIAYSMLAACTIDRPMGLLTIVKTLAVVAICVSLSLGIEFTQIFFAPRTSSQNDIAAETLGSVIGCGMWLWFGRSTTNWWRVQTENSGLDSKIDRWLLAYTVGWLAYSLLPVDLTIHPIELLHKLQIGRVIFLPFSQTTWDAPTIWKLLIDVVLLLPVGAWLMWSELSRRQPNRTVAESVVLGVVILATIEFAQLFIYSRAASATHVVTGALGVWIGAGLANRFHDDVGLLLEASSARHRQLSLWKWTLGIVAYSLILCGVFWFPFEIIDDEPLIQRRLNRFFSVPFAAMYWSSEFDALKQILKDILYFLPLGAALAHVIISKSKHRRMYFACAVLYCLLLASLLVLGQSFLPKNYRDVTDVLLCTFGAMAGMNLRNRLSTPHAFELHSTDHP